MRKSLSLLFALCLLLSLNACGTETAQTTAPAESAAPVTESEQAATAEEGDFAPDFVFSATDLDGNVYDESFFSQNELTMINFWASWCGPCVGEMPDLQKLQENYADRGFAILGVCVDWAEPESVRDAVELTGVKYPILDAGTDLDFLQSMYIPTTVFVDGEGHILYQNGGNQPADAQYIGSNSYAAWAEFVEGLLG